LMGCVSALEDAAEVGNSTITVAGIPISPRRSEGAQGQAGGLVRWWGGLVCGGGLVFVVVVELLGLGGGVDAG
jgi:uncharacterized membrane protein